MPYSYYVKDQPSVKKSNLILQVKKIFLITCWNAKKIFSAYFWLMNYPKKVDIKINYFLKIIKEQFLCKVLNNWIHYGTQYLYTNLKNLD